MSISEDWEVIVGFLPKGWRNMAEELGAHQRSRGFSSEDDLLRTLLIHFGEGCSLRETVVRAKEGGFADITDVAFLKRLTNSGEWLQWMAREVMNDWLGPIRLDTSDCPVRVRVIDGTTVQPPGSKGTKWRIHYSMELSSLHCDEVKITGPKTAESFSNFTVGPGDLFMGDRVYAKAPAIHKTVSTGADVLVRIGLSSIVFEDEDGVRFGILEHLRTLKYNRVGDWPVVIPYGDHRVFGRICAVRKSKGAAKRARKKVQRESSKKGRKTRPETLEAAEYTFVFTTLDRSIPAETVLHIYRARWQVELVFKRLKSLLGLGHLQHTNPVNAKAWLHGKLLLAFLIEAFRGVAAILSPEDTESTRKRPRNRSIWRETRLMLHFLLQAINPTNPLLDRLRGWSSISGALRERSRKRQLQMDSLLAECAHPSLS